MADGSSPEKVRQFTPAERQELIDFVAVRIFRRLLCRRSVIWAKWIASTGGAALVAVRWGADVEEAIIRLLDTWPKVLHALGFI